MDESSINNNSENFSPENNEKDVYKKTVKGRTSNWKSKWNANKKKSSLPKNLEANETFEEKTKLPETPNESHDLVFVDSHAHLADSIYRKDRSKYLPESKETVSAIKFAVKSKN